MHAPHEQPGSLLLLSIKKASHPGNVRTARGDSSEQESAIILRAEVASDVDGDSTGSHSTTEPSFHREFLSGITSTRLQGLI